MLAFSFLLSQLSPTQQWQVYHCHTFKNGCYQGHGPCISYIIAPLDTILGWHRCSAISCVCHQFLIILLILHTNCSWVLKGNLAFWDPHQQHVILILKSIWQYLPNNIPEVAPSTAYLVTIEISCFQVSCRSLHSLKSAGIWNIISGEPATPWEWEFFFENWSNSLMYMSL